MTGFDKEIFNGLCIMVHGDELAQKDMLIAEIKELSEQASFVMQKFTEMKKHRHSPPFLIQENGRVQKSDGGLNEELLQETSITGLEAIRDNFQNYLVQVGEWQAKQVQRLNVTEEQVRNFAISEDVFLKSQDVEKTPEEVIQSLVSSALDSNLTPGQVQECLNLLKNLQPAKHDSMIATSSKVQAFQLYKTLVHVTSEQGISDLEKKIQKQASVHPFAGPAVGINISALMKGLSK